MLDPNKHGIYNKEKTMKPNWGIISVLALTIFFWTNIWFNGFINSVIWLVIFTAIIGLILKLKGDI